MHSSYQQPFSILSTNTTVKCIQYFKAVVISGIKVSNTSALVSDYKACFQYYSMLSPKLHKIFKTKVTPTKCLPYQVNYVQV